MQINIRKAEAKDIVDVFKLSNLNSTRKYSVNPKKILWEEHVKWYNEVIKNERMLLYVLFDEKGKFLGQVRFNVNYNLAEISISIIDEIKGKGYSLDILKICQELIVMEKKVNRIIAIINDENKISLKLFERAGYKFVNSENDFSKYILVIGGCN